MKLIKISSEFITLGQFLKYSGIISTGGMVKPFLAENDILVDGVDEKRRGKKLYKNAIVEIKNIGSFKIDNK